jgi:hypothetical protein
MPVLPLVESSRIFPGASLPAGALRPRCGGGAVFDRSAGVVPFGLAPKFYLGKFAGRGASSGNSGVLPMPAPAELLLALGQMAALVGKATAMARSRERLLSCGCRCPCDYSNVPAISKKVYLY